MKVATRLLYLLTVLVLALGLYFAFNRRVLDDRTATTRAAIAAPAPAGQGPQPTAHTRPSPGEAAPATTRPWWSDQKSDAETVRRLRAWMTPDRKEMNAIAKVIRVRLRFAELYGLLALDKTAIARFEMAAAEASLTFTELVGTPEQIADHAVGEARRMDKVVLATLGADYVPAFRAYLQTSDLRLMTAELAVNSHYTDKPLSAAQADQLLRIALENRRGPAPGPRIDPDTINWERVARHAGEFLTPAQLQSLQAMLARRRFDAEFKDATGLPMRRPVRGI